MKPLAMILMPVFAVLLVCGSTAAETRRTVGNSTLAPSGYLNAAKMKTDYIIYQEPKKQSLLEKSIMKIQEFFNLKLKAARITENHSETPPPEAEEVAVPMARRVEGKNDKASTGFPSPRPTAGPPPRERAV